MGPVIGIFVVLHFLGMAAILGGWLALRLGATKGITVLVWAARAQLLIGLALVALLEIVSADLNMAKIAVKLVVALAAVACAEIANVRQGKGTPAPRLVDLAAVFAVLNVLVAVMWRTES
ncbi:hypothetical protein [Propionicimonas paludicola]|nr:hypothetical protein [Propionicimonas paludicola]